MVAKNNPNNFMSQSIGPGYQNLQSFALKPGQYHSQYQSLSNNVQLNQANVPRSET